MKRSPIGVCFLMTLAFIFCAGPSLSKADDIVRYRVVLRGMGIHIGEFKGEVGVYDTWDEAQKVTIDWDKSHLYDFDRIATIETQVGKTARTVIGVAQQIGDARKAVDIARGKARERKPGSTLREYQRAITDAWRRVTNLRTTMLAGTGGILKQDFNEANKVIADFNHEAEAYNEQTAGQSGFDKIQMVDPVTTTIQFQEPPFVDVKPIASPQPAETNLTGKEYSGSIGQAKATIEFKNGSFTVSGDIAGQGRYRQSGNGVRMETETSIYRGVVSGDGIKGYRIFKDRRPYEQWNVRLKPTVKSLSELGRPLGPKPTASVIGTWTYRGDNVTTITFESGGTVYMTLSSGNTRNSNWTKIGDNRFSVAWPSGKIIYEVQGNVLQEINPVTNAPSYRSWSK